MYNLREEMSDKIYLAYKFFYMPTKNHKVKSSVKVPKVLVAVAKVLAIISPALLVRFLARLFTSPRKHKIPKREIPMDRNSKQTLLHIPHLTNKVMVYEYGESSKKILLVHGWSGRGTQLFKFADLLLKNGFSTVSFDAPAHGKSDGTTTLMPDFITTIHEIDKKYGPFTAAIGHSLGGMSLLNSVKTGLILDSLVIVGSGDIVDDIITDFINKFNVNPSYAARMRSHFENLSKQPMDNYSAYHAAAATEIPTLVIHDENDDEVPVTSGKHIYKHLRNGELLITKGLGHRKILGDEKVINTALNFILKNENEKSTSNSDRIYNNFMQ